MRRLKQISVLSLTLIACGSVAVGANVGALGYQSNSIPLTFNFDTTMTVTLSNNSLLVDNLSPTAQGTSDPLNITVATNDTTGYTLMATVGNAQNASTDLTSNNGGSSITMVDIDGSALNADTNVSKWGYVLGDNTTFNKLPLYTASPKTINSYGSQTEPDPTEHGLTSFKIGAYAASTQASGDYTNVINFIAVANSAVAAASMQDYTLSQCAADAADSNVTLYDKRDNKSYTVRYINGECWMTQNLRYVGDATNSTMALTTANSNVTADVPSLTYYSLDSTDASYADHCDSTNSYNYACIKDSGNATTGVWYNYYAATAGTVSTNFNSTDATQDICPANWRLPTGPNTIANRDLNKLIGNTTSGWQDPTSGLTAFGAVAGDGYLNGSLSGFGVVSWWSATAVSDTKRLGLSYNSSNGQFVGNASGFRYYGFSVRCVRSS